MKKWEEKDITLKGENRKSFLIICAVLVIIFAGWAIMDIIEIYFHFFAEEEVLPQ